MRQILIVGGGYAGFYAAWKLEKRLRPDEAAITVVDPRPYMTYQPFLPEVTSGSMEARHAAVSLRRNLRRSEVLAAKVTQIRHQDKTARVRPLRGPAFDLDYDIIVVTAGAVTRHVPVPGVDEFAIGLKHVEEAVAIRDRLMVAFDLASGLPPGPERTKLLTIAYVGGGFTGVEGFGELLSLATSMLKRYPRLSSKELSFHLVEAGRRILPEVTEPVAEWVVGSLRERGAHVHLNTQLVSAHDGHVVLSSGLQLDVGLIVWTAGNAANPMVSNRTDLPVDDRGLLVVRPDLRVGTQAQAVEDAWGAGDNAAVPDLTAPRPGTLTVPNAQHAVRQGKHLAANIAASLHGGRIRPYRHRNLGVVATLGLGRGVFQSGPVTIKGPLAWAMHRGYHVLAVPTWDRKVRVLADWLPTGAFGRDIVSLDAVQHPRAAFIDDAQLDHD